MVNRLFLLVAVVVLSATFSLVTPSLAAAQMGGGRGGHGGSGRQSPSQGTDTTADDFHKAVALQATDEQRTQFQTAAKRAEAATKLAEELQQRVAQPAELPNYASQAAALKASIDNSKSAMDVFLGGFDKEQSSGLKVPVKKLNKARTDVDSKWKAVSRELERTNVDGRKLSVSANDLVRALADFRSRQSALGTEMGIQD
jgi:hypothetical protein